MSFITHLQFRKKLQRVSALNPAAKIIGLDLGTKYIGVSISEDFVVAKSLRTFKLDLSLQDPTDSFAPKFRNLVRNKQVKGLVVGYPLSQTQKETPFCLYVLNFMKNLSEKHKINIPVTLVDERETT